MKELITATRAYREMLLSDPYRPTYHFAPPDDNGFPGDPNGAFFADGVYHLMYLYSNTGTRGFHWGHISSVDLLHWRHHPDALTIEDDDKGCFSGGAFVDEDKTAYLTFWKFPSGKEGGDNGGIGMACSGPPYDKWERMEHISCADPSNIWKVNGIYYMQTGNKCVLDGYGREETSSEHYQGDWTDLFRSEDLKKWEFVHRFYENTHDGNDWPDKTEDDMCPSFLPLYDAKENGRETGKWLQLFISHNKGCQYYVGTFEEEKFIPEHHGRMSWVDSAYFAPEALVDDKNRHIIWTWLRDNMENDFQKYGWTGVYGFPRVVWWEHNRLRMAPARELDLLQYHRQEPHVDEKKQIPVENGEIFRLKAEIDIADQKISGFSIRRDDAKGIHTDIYYDKERQVLVFDATESGAFGWRVKEEAPLALDELENLKLDIFADKSVIEVYANEKQAICRRVYPENPGEAVGIKLIGSRESVRMLEVWDMAPTNPY